MRIMDREGEGTQGDEDHWLVEAVTGFDEGVKFLVGVIDDVGVQLNAVVHTERSCEHTTVQW